MHKNVQNKGTCLLCILYFYSFNQLCKTDKTYRGYRLLAVDGSDIYITHNEDSDTLFKIIQYFKPTKNKANNPNHTLIPSSLHFLNKAFQIQLKPHPEALLPPFLLKGNHSEVGVNHTSSWS